MNKLRNLLRFSLLELLWICAVLAVFLGLNLRTLEFNSQGNFVGDHSENTSTVSYVYFSGAGWPFAYISSIHSSPQTHVYPTLKGPTFEEIRQAYKSDMQKMPGIVPGTRRPSFESVWRNSLGIDYLSILYIVLVALGAILVPILTFRFLKRNRSTPTPEHPTSRVTQA